MKLKIVLLSLAFLVVSFATSPTASAETMHNGAMIQLNGRSSTPKVNEYYIYVKPGERAVVRLDITNSFGTAANGGTVTMFAPDGGIVGAPVEINAADYGVPGNVQNKPSSATIISPIAAEAGVYAVNITSKTGAASGGFRARWTMGATVTNEAAIVGGRVWTEVYQITQDMPSVIGDMRLYYVGEHGIMYEAHYLNYNGIDSNIYSDNVGSGVTNGCLPVYASIDLSRFAENQPAHTSVSTCNRPYKIFFDRPDETLPATVILPGGRETWLKPPIINTRITDMQFVSDDVASFPVRGTITANIDHYIGNLTLKVDANGNGSFNDPGDREIPFSNTSTSILINFDGKDGNGNSIPESVRVGFRIEANMKGEIHFIRNDAEISGGISVRRLNGSAVNPTYLYWDDRHLVHNCGVVSVTPVSNTIGVDSTGGVHGWSVDGCVAINGSPSYGNDSGQNSMTAQQYRAAASWGNLRNIDDWTYDYGLAYASTTFYAEPKTLSGVGALGVPNTGLKIVTSDVAPAIIVVGAVVYVIHRRLRQ